MQFNITYGQYGDPWNGAIAAIMLAKASVLDGIAIYYPNQVPVDQTMIQYAPAVGLWRDGGSSGVWGTEAIDEVQVRRCAFSGVYAGVIALIPAAYSSDFTFRHLTVQDCWWRRYYRGIVIDGCVDVCQVEGVFAKGDTYTQANGEFISAGRADWFWVDRTFAVKGWRFFRAIASRVSTAGVHGIEIRSSGADSCGTSCVTVSSVDTSPWVPSKVTVANSQFVTQLAAAYGVWINGVPQVNLIGNHFWGIGREAVHVTSASTVNIISNIVDQWSAFNPGYAAFSITSTVNGNIAYNLCQDPATGAGPCVSTSGNTNVSVFGVTSP